MQFAASCAAHCLQRSHTPCARCSLRPRRSRQPSPSPHSVAAERGRPSPPGSISAPSSRHFRPPPPLPPPPPTFSPPQEAERSAGRNTAWLKLVRRSGTAQDRVAASVVQVQSNILGNLKALDHLLELMDPARGSGGKRGAGQALEALRELFGDWCGTRL